MSVTEIMQAGEFTMAECHLIASHAYERYIKVEPWQIHPYLDQWRLWYYHILPDYAVLSLPGARRIPPSGR